MEDPLLILYAVSSLFLLKTMPLLLRVSPLSQKNNAEEKTIEYFDLENKGYTIKSKFESKGIFKRFEYNLFEDKEQLFLNTGRITGYCFSRSAYVYSLVNFKSNSNEKSKQSFSEFEIKVEENLKKNNVKKLFFDSYVGLLDSMNNRGFKIVNPLVRYGLLNKRFFYEILPKTDFPTFLTSKNLN